MCCSASDKPIRNVRSSVSNEVLLGRCMILSRLIALIWLMSQLSCTHLINCCQCRLIYDASIASKLLLASSFVARQISSGWAPVTCLEFWKVGCPGVHFRCTFSKVFNFFTLNIIRPPGTAVPDGLMFYPRCFFFSPRFLRYPSTDRSETLPHDTWYICWTETSGLSEFYKLTSKIPGVLPQKNLGAKNMQNFGQLINFGPLQTLTSNISGTRQQIQNRKDVRTSKIPPAFNEESLVNFGPLTAWNYMWVWTH